MLHHVNHMASQQAVDQMSCSEKAVNGNLRRASGLLQAACLTVLSDNSMICACLSVIQTVCHTVCLSYSLSVILLILWGMFCTVKTDLQVAI